MGCMYSEFLDSVLEPLVRRPVSIMQSPPFRACGRQGAAFDSMTQHAEMQMITCGVMTRNGVPVGTRHMMEVSC